MGRNEIIAALKEEITLLYNCTDDGEVRGMLKTILHGERVLLCKCPMCGETFNTAENMKASKKIVPATPPS